MERTDGTWELISQKPQGSIVIQYLTKLLGNVRTLLKSASFRHSTIATGVNTTLACRRKEIGDIF